MQPQTGISVQFLHLLRSDIEHIEQLLINVATGGDRVQDVEDDYEDLCKRIQTSIHVLEKNGARISVELFHTLWQWHQYWSKNLKSYASRRAFITEKFSKILNALESSIREVKSGVASSAQIVTLLNSYGASRPILRFDAFHPAIVQRCSIHIENGQYDDAILTAMKLVETRLREEAGLVADDVGVNLATKAFAPKDGLLTLSELKTVSEQDALHQLMRGALGLFKNPLSHRFMDETDPQKTLMVLGFATLLLGLIDRAHRRQ